MLQETKVSDLSSSKKSRKAKFISAGAVFFTAAATVGIWSYYSWRLKDVAPFPRSAPRKTQPVAVIALAQQSAVSQESSTEGQALPTQGQGRTRFRSGLDPMRKIQEDLNRNLTEAALREIAPSFGVDAALLGQKDNSNDSRYQAATFRLLDGVEKAPIEQRPAILFAANLAAEHLMCLGSYEERTAQCSELQKLLAKYGIALKNDELGGGLYYPDVLLWRIWKEYPQTVWGEQVFVLLLERGWDTSGVCERGGDQTQEVIRQGEAFLRERSASPYREEVTFLVAEAYASWWSMGVPGDSAMADYVDPKQYQKGAEEARTKAIGYFETVLREAPLADLGEYAREVLPHLREQHVLDDPKFLCIYD